MNDLKPKSIREWFGQWAASIGLVEPYIAEITELRGKGLDQLELNKQLVPLLQAQRSQRVSANRLWCVIGLSLIFLQLPNLIDFKLSAFWFPSWSFAQITIGLLIALRPFYFPFWLKDQALSQAQIELDLEVAKQRDDRYAADRMLRQQQVEIQKYTRQGLRMSNIAQALGVLCILLGFATLAGTAWVLQSAPSKGATAGTLDSNLVTAIFGGVSGLLANYVAVLFLRVHAESHRTFGKLHREISDSYVIHLGAFLAAQISAQQQKDSTYASMALETVRILNVREADRRLGDLDSTTAPASTPNPEQQPEGVPSPPV